MKEELQRPKKILNPALPFWQPLVEYRTKFSASIIHYHLIKQVKLYQFAETRILSHEPACKRLAVKANLLFMGEVFPQRVKGERKNLLYGRQSALHF